ncbi:MAG: type II toxin-antitoxin system HicB family antitoxin [Truepera sp.]|nr:type II toxin-antitoxin system HicB family antitoxin [Truepera sp.]
MPGTAGTMQFVPFGDVVGADGAEWFSIDDEADVFHGEVVDTRDVIVFEGTSVAQLKKEFKFSVDDYLKVCEERGRTPDKPFSGKIPLRVPPEVHRAATAAAKA